MFNRYGVPDSIITDNGALLCIISVRNICEVIELPTYNYESRAEQSNGKAENAVRTVRHLFAKCRAAGVSEFQALLDWRNTPSKGMDTSSAQRFFGRGC